MSIHDGVPSALEIGLHNKLTPKFFISRGEDDALQWQPPARSRELANALSYHYPLEHTIEEKMQRAILDFLESEFPNRFPSPETFWDNSGHQGEFTPPNSAKDVGKVSQDVPQVRESPTKPSQLVQGSEMFGAWDVKTGKTVKHKGRKRGLSPTTRRRVAENRGNTCTYHRKAKTQCHPSQCRQNKLYPGTTRNSISTEINQGPTKQKDESIIDSSQMSTSGSATKLCDDGHFEKRFKALPSPSLSPLQSETLLEGDRTTCYDLDQNDNGYGPISTEDDIQIRLFSSAEPGHASVGVTLEGSKSKPQELSNFVENSQWLSDRNEAHPLVNEINTNRDQSTAEYIPSARYTDFDEVLPSALENGNTDHTDWIEDGSDLPSLERDWPKEDADGLFEVASLNPYSSVLDFGQTFSSPRASYIADLPGSDPTHDTVHGDNIESAWRAPDSWAAACRPQSPGASIQPLAGLAEARSIVESHMKSSLHSPARIAVAAQHIPSQSPTLRLDKPATNHSYYFARHAQSKSSSQMRLPSSQFQSQGYYGNSSQQQVVNYKPRREGNGAALSLDSSYEPLMPPHESKDTERRNEASRSIVTGKSIMSEREEMPEDLGDYWRNMVEETKLSPSNGVPFLPRENAKIPIADLITSLRNSSLRFTGTFEQLNPETDETSLIDIVLLGGTEQKASTELNPRMIRDAFGASLDKLRLLRSSYDISFESSLGEILSDQSSSNKLPDELEISNLVSGILNNQAETFSAQDSILIYIGSLLGLASPTSSLDSGRLVTLLFRLTAATTIAKRVIVAPIDPVANYSSSTSYTLRWLDPKWRTVESIIADMDTTTDLKAPRVSNLRMLSTAPPITSHFSPPAPLFARRYIDQDVEKRCQSDADERQLHENLRVAPILSPISSPVLNGSIERAEHVRHARRQSHRSRKGTAVANKNPIVVIKNPVDAVKALWTRLARVKL